MLHVSAKTETIHPHRMGATGSNTKTLTSKINGHNFAAVSVATDKGGGKTVHVGMSQDGATRVQVFVGKTLKHDIRL